MGCDEIYRIVDPGRQSPIPRIVLLCLPVPTYWAIPSGCGALSAVDLASLR